MPGRSRNYAIVLGIPLLFSGRSPACFRASSMQARFRLCWRQVAPVYLSRHTRVVTFTMPAPVPIAYCCVLLLASFST